MPQPCYNLNWTQRGDLPVCVEKQIMTDGNDGVRKTDDAAQRERPLRAARRSGRGFSSRPGASGEKSRTQRSVTAHKAAGGRVSCNLGGTTELSHSLRPFVGAEAVFVFACHKNTASGGGRRKNHEERYSYAMDRFERTARKVLELL